MAVDWLCFVGIDSVAVGIGIAEQAVGSLAAVGSLYFVDIDSAFVAVDRVCPSESVAAVVEPDMAVAAQVVGSLYPVDFGTVCFDPLVATVFARHPEGQNIDY